MLRRRLGGYEGLPPAAAPAAAAEPFAPSLAVSSGGGMNQGISRFVLYFGATAVAIVWLSSLYCFARGWMRRINRERSLAAADKPAPAGARGCCGLLRAAGARPCQAACGAAVRCRLPACPWDAAAPPPALRRPL